MARVDRKESGSAVVCLRCGEPAVKTDTVEHPKGRQGPLIEMYKCEADTCGARAALMFEPVGGVNDDEASWVEKEVAKRGSFFPTDFNNRGPRNW